MRVWLACFVLLFALAELFDWLKDFSLPLPIYILGGAFLAVASNYDKFVGYYFSDTSMTASTASLETTQLDASTQPLAAISSSVEDSEKSEK
ncbi:hypothetical protein H6G76_23975 [Nostoc sp. FACHB-152]|uniref:hypothetical protein n=1 Tax=unclassified Nostoc TaxID=2593658 RepID=UPI001683741F|nr:MULTISPECIES: hypothetical protein [unclassified Nostoc]MBD2450163.1 hypothetical protein [Nostoc sp. FACHB-152]MBD2471346.1 hypothetical protein [Nostoc sp. FACHB-145]